MSTIFSTPVNLEIIPSDSDMIIGWAGLGWAHLTSKQVMEQLYLRPSMMLRPPCWVRLLQLRSSLVIFLFSFNKSLTASLDWQPSLLEERLRLLINFSSDIACNNSDCPGEMYKEQQRTPSAMLFLRHLLSGSD